MSENKSRVVKDKLNFDTLLINELGQFGKFQLVTILLIALPAIFSGFMAGDYIFTAARLPHRCLIPDCDEAEPEFKPKWITNTIPVDKSGNLDDCLRFESLSGWENVTDCPYELFDRNKKIPCEKYVYERTNSVVFDFGLECQEWLRALAGTLNSLGGMFGLPLAGFISDNFGRRTSVLFYSFNMALMGLVRSFSVNYVMYAALQFLQTAAGGGVFSAAYVLTTEVVGLKYRVKTSATMSSLFAFGQALLGLIAWAVYEWRTLSLVLHVPMFILLANYWLLSESPRWLLSKNKNKEAKIIMNKIAQMNNKTISEKTINSLTDSSLDHTENSPKESTQSDSPLFMKIIRSPILLRRCCITPVWWMTTTFIYYGLSINSVSLSGNMYLNYVTSAIIEIPGYWTAVLVLDKVGRRTTLFCGYILNAVCCLVFAFIPSNLPVLSLVLYLIGKFCIAVVFTSLYLYTSELYPTRHRHSLLAFSSTIGRIGSVLAPLTPPLMVYWSGIPSTMFGCMALLSGLLVLTQPETLHIKLPDTIEDAETIGK